MKKLTIISIIFCLWSIGLGALVFSGEMDLGHRLYLATGYFLAVLLNGFGLVCLHLAKKQSKLRQLPPRLPWIPPDLLDIDKYDVEAEERAEYWVDTDTEE